MSNATLPRSCPIGRENPRRARRSYRLDDLWYLKTGIPVRQDPAAPEPAAPIDPPDRRDGGA